MNYKIENVLKFLKTSFTLLNRKKGNLEKKNSLGTKNQNFWDEPPKTDVNIIEFF